MELIHAQYRATNSFGSRIVSGEHAREVWKSWPTERRDGSPEHGFVVWDIYEETRAVLMTTTFIPIPEQESTD